MKKTKNKVIKGISVLVNGPLYCALFFSVGWDCVAKKPIQTITLEKSAHSSNTEPDDPSDNSSGEIIDPEPNNISDGFVGQENDPSHKSSIRHEQGEDNPVFESTPRHSTDDSNDLSAQPDEESAPVPPSQPSNSSPKVVIGEASSKTNATNKRLMLKKQKGSRLFNKLDPQNTTPGSPKKKEDRGDGQKMRQPKSPETNRDRLENVKEKGHTQAKPHPSGDKPMTSDSSNDIINPDIEEALNKFSKLLGEVEKKLDTLKLLMNEKEKNNKKGLVKQVESFLADNRIERMKDIMKIWTQEEQKKHVKGLLYLAGLHEKDLDKQISKKQSKKK